MSRNKPTPHTLKYSWKKLEPYLCLKDNKVESNIDRFSAVLLVNEPKEILRFSTK